MADPGQRRLIAEWEPQAAVMVCWPHPETDWGRGGLQTIEATYAAICEAVACRERLLVCCYDAAHASRVHGLLAGHGIRPDRFECRTVRFNDTWCRDYGPLGVETDAGTLLVKFLFNGWGGRYDARLDDQVTTRLHGDGAFGEVPLETCDWVLEGGSIDTDGLGTVITTSRCLLADNRNSGASRHAVEALLRHRLGTARVLWLDRGALRGDDTDAHVDMLVRFGDPDTLIHAGWEGADSDDRQALREMEAQLSIFRRTDGGPYRLVSLPMPAPVVDDAGRRRPATYANFLIINGAVLVPTYDDPADGVALEIIRERFPARAVIGIPSLPLIREGGGVHCACMQLPRPAPRAQP